MAAAASTQARIVARSGLGMRFRQQEDDRMMIHVRLVDIFIVGVAVG